MKNLLDFEVKLGRQCKNVKLGDTSETRRRNI